MASIRRIIADESETVRSDDAAADGATAELGSDEGVEVIPDAPEPVSADIYRWPQAVSAPTAATRETQATPYEIPSSPPPAAAVEPGDRPQPVAEASAALQPDAPTPRPTVEPHEAEAGPAGPNANIVSQATTASVGQAFSLLSNTVLAQNNRTIEDLVQELLKPMLKVWLDDNLPPLVERLVRHEIERVARGSR